VTFKEEVEEKIMDEYHVKGRSLKLIRAETKAAIEGHVRGDSEAYDNIKEVFAPRRNRDDGGEEEMERRADMKGYLLALTGFAASLNKNCNGLVKAVVGCEWMGREEGFVDVYVRFLGGLVSAQGAYVGVVLGMLVEHFHGGKTNTSLVILRR
jgi:RNA polymerase I-specific transcription initiation factor RRN3